MRVTRVIRLAGNRGARGYIHCMDHPEVPLTGGRVTPGIIRKGDTVRRPITRDRSFQQDLLAHLEARGFDRVPRFLGLDEQGREVLTFIKGDVPSDLGHFSDEQLCGAARLLRRFHDATADFYTVVAAATEVICHNDWGPPNCVFVNGMPYALIDFDTLAPGLRLWDLGYSAFSWLDIGNDDYSGKEQIRRMALFLDAYAVQGYSIQQLAVFMIARQSALASWSASEGKSEIADWAAAVRDWTIREIVEPLMSTAFSGP
jgi:hypothetical protein